MRGNFYGERILPHLRTTHTAHDYTCCFICGARICNNVRMMRYDMVGSVLRDGYKR